MTTSKQDLEGAPSLTDEQIDDIAKGYVTSLGGDHWYSGERGIKDDSDLTAFARQLIAADRALRAPAAAPLTDAQMTEIVTAHAGYGHDDFGNVIRAVERHFGIGAVVFPAP